MQWVVYGGRGAGGGRLARYGEKSGLMSGRETSWEVGRGKSVAAAGYWSVCVSAASVRIGSRRQRIGKKMQLGSRISSNKPKVDLRIK
jgi:hypothetical protein